MRECEKCGEHKPLDRFGSDGHGNIRHTCKPCINQKLRKRRADAGPAANRDYWLRQRYGITQVDYDRLVVGQGGLCACCGEPCDALVVDHDHRTGAVRGLACTACNTAIGKLGDNLAGVMRAVTYLQRSELCTTA